MTRLEQLRLAAALGHTVPAAELRLHTDCGEEIIVSHHPSADISPCAFRRVVAASVCPNQPDLAYKVVAISIGGALVDLGGGVLSSRCVADEQRWVASLLTPQRISDLLDGVGLDKVPPDALHACLKPDSDLGVTIVAVTANDVRYHHLLDEIAAQVAAACFVEELCCAAASASHSNDHVGGAS